HPLSLYAAYPPSTPERRGVMTRRIAIAVLAVTAVLGGCAPGADVEPADLVLTNGRIVTVDDAVPEAQAVAITGDRIVAVGSARQIRAHIGPDTEVLDLEGRLAIPGFIEGH